MIPRGHGEGGAGTSRTNLKSRGARGLHAGAGAGAGRQGVGLALQAQRPEDALSRMRRNFQGSPPRQPTKRRSQKRKKARPRPPGSRLSTRLGAEAAVGEGLRGFPEEVGRLLLNVGIATL